MQTNFRDYDWSRSLDENLGRETIAQGSRLATFQGGPDSLTSQALKGENPIITTPVLVGKPEGDSNLIPWIVRGYGRIKSVLHWEDLEPVERFRDALRPYVKGTEKTILTEGELDGFGVDVDVSTPSAMADEIAKLEIFANAEVSKLRPDSIGSSPRDIAAAFFATVTVPFVLFDGTKEEARKLAWSDVAQETVTMADQLARLRVLSGRNWRRSTIAQDLKVSPGRVSHYQGYLAACSSDGLVRKEKKNKASEVVTAGEIVRVAPAMDTLIRVHMGVPKHEKLPKGKTPVSFDRLGGPRYLGFMASKGSMTVDDQLAGIARAAGDEQTPADIETLSEPNMVALARAIDGKDLLDALDAIRAEAEQAELSQEELDRREAAKTAPDTPQSTAPSIASIQRLFSVERWGEDDNGKAITPHPYRAMFLQIGLLVHGHIAPEQFLIDSASVKRQAKPPYAAGSANVPVEAGETVQTLAKLSEQAAKKAAASKAAQEKEAARLAAQEAKKNEAALAEANAALASAQS